MAGLMNKVAKFARSPQGRKMTEQAKRMASDPKNRAKIDQYRKKFANKQR